MKEKLLALEKFYKEKYKVSDVRFIVHGDSSGHVEIYRAEWPEPYPFVSFDNFTKFVDTVCSVCGRGDT